MILALAAATGAARGNTNNVAILSTTQDPARDIDMKNKILANAPFLSIDIINVTTSTPSLAFMSSYQSVLVVGGDNAFQNAGALGDMLASYIDAGHGIVMAASSNVASMRVLGTFDSLNYWAINPGLLKVNSHLTLGTVFAPLSPLMNGVTTFDGGSSSLWIDGSVKPAATLIANWSNGAPLVATWTSPGGGREVALNFYPPSSDANPALWNASTDGGRLLANALLYAGDISDVPEPLTLLLSGAGLTLIGMLGTRRSGRRV